MIILLVIRLFIISKIISFIYEKDMSLKINKFAPGTNIKIKKEKSFNNIERRKGIILNFAWHISSEIKRYMKTKLKYHGKVIDIISNKDFK